MPMNKTPQISGMKIKTYNLRWQACLYLAKATHLRSYTNSINDGEALQIFFREEMTTTNSEFLIVYIYRFNEVYQFEKPLQLLWSVQITSKLSSIISLWLHWWFLNWSNFEFMKYTVQLKEWQNLIVKTYLQRFIRSSINSSPDSRNLKLLSSIQKTLIKFILESTKKITHRVYLVGISWKSMLPYNFESNGILCNKNEQKSFWSHEQDQPTEKFSL